MPIAALDPILPTAAPADAEPLRPQERTFQELRRDILLGRLRPRERLVEGDLAGRFGVGRYVVRAALDELCRIGLAARRPNRGVVVADYDPAEVAKLYEVREILQGAAIARMPLPAPAALLATLREINARYLAAHARGALDEVAEANSAFHAALFAACDNPFLAEAIGQFWEKTAAIHGYAVGVPDLARRSHREHAEMIDCLAAGERERLAELCNRHMTRSLEAVSATGRGWR